MKGRAKVNNSNSLNPDKWLTVEQMMNKNFKALHVEDTLRTVVEYYQKYKINTLPIIDENENLIGVFPKKRLFKALLENENLDVLCEPYMVKNPIFVRVDRTYDEYSLVFFVTKSRVDNVVVLDYSDKVVGMIGTVEYLHDSLNMIKASSAILESLFRVKDEGIIITDREGCILRINPAAERMFQLKFSEDKGKRMKDVLPEIMILEGRHIGIKTTIKALTFIVVFIPMWRPSKIIISGRTSFSLLPLSSENFNWNILSAAGFIRNMHPSRSVMIIPSSFTLNKDSRMADDALIIFKLSCRYSTVPIIPTTLSE